MLSRAYSLLEIKALTPSKQGGGLTITGIATSPEADRMGDEIVMSGVRFRNPVPLFLSHDKDKSIGLARFQKATDDGVPFEAEILDPESVQSAAFRDRLLEAIDLVRTKIIRAVSIGFTPLDDAIERLKTGGLRFLKTELLELSLVPIPANVNATILTVKQFDISPAASGTGVGVVRILPGASGSTRTGQTMKTIQEQITAFEATRQAKSARMTELMTTAGEKGETLDEAQEQEYDGLEREVKSIDAHLTRLNALEEANKKAAQPVNGSDPKKAAESRGGVISVKSNLPPGTAFTRYAMALAASRGSRFEAAEYAKKWERDTPEVAMVLKAAVDAGTTTDATWAAPLVVYQNIASEFIELLRPATIIGRIPGLRRVPFNIQMPSQTSGSTVGWVGQGKPKPVGELAFSSLSLGMAKAAGIVVLAEELVRSSSPSAEAIVRADLIAAIAQFLDLQFIDPAVAAVANVSPASITNGATVVDATGTTAAAFRADVKTAFATFTGANISLGGLVWIMTESQALAFSMIQNALGQPEYPGITATGGTLFGIPVIASENVPAEGGSPAGERIILVKASEILLADDGGVTLDVSREASVQMNTAPDDPATASTVMVSLWQNNLVGLRAERFINWARRRTEAVVVIEGAVYVG